MWRRSLAPDGSSDRLWRKERRVLAVRQRRHARKAPGMPARLGARRRPPRRPAARMRELAGPQRARRRHPLPSAAPRLCLRRIRRPPSRGAERPKIGCGSSGCRSRSCALPSSPCCRAAVGGQTAVSPPARASLAPPLLRRQPTPRRRRYSAQVSTVHVRTDLDSTERTSTAQS